MPYGFRLALAFTPIVIGMDWRWIAAALTLPIAAALLVAPFFWHKGDNAIGNVVGSGLIFLGVILLLSREYVEVARVRHWCQLSGTPCVFHPLDFSRYAIYGAAGFADVMALFLVSLWSELRARRKTVAPEWR